MRSSKLVLITVLALSTLAVSSRPALAGCWECGFEGGSEVCVGLAAGQDGWSGCTFVDVGIKEPLYICYPSGSYGICSQAQQCPGCLRYPAVPAEPAPIILSTQVLVYSADLMSNPAVGGKISIAANALMDPLALGRIVGAASGELPALVASSIESSTRSTMTERKLTSGERFLVKVDPQPSGARIRLFYSKNGESWDLAGRTEVAPTEVAVFGITLAGLPRLVLVHPTVTIGAADLFESYVPNLHEEFIAAGDAYPILEPLQMLRADGPTSKSDRFALLVRAMSDHALDTVMRQAYR